MQHKYGTAKKRYTANKCLLIIMAINVHKQESNDETSKHLLTMKRCVISNA